MVLFTRITLTKYQEWHPNMDLNHFQAQSHYRLYMTWKILCINPTSITTGNIMQEVDIMLPISSFEYLDNDLDNITLVIQGFNVKLA